jgi:methylmalonyl-CoA epimerase
MKVKRLHHVAVAVRDTAKFERLLGETLGLAVTRRYERNAKNILKTVFGFEGGPHLELIEPVSSENNSCVAWIDRRGSSLHHIALEVDDIDAAVSELKERGVRMTDEEPRLGAGGARVAFIHPEATENVIVELIETPKAELGA